LISFHKYHGAGNDFILTENPLAAQHARILCHRYLGIGADGVLLLEPSEIADIKMRIFNSDGSEAPCCGNGLRCVVKHLKKSVTIESLAGISEGIYTPSSISITLPKALILKKIDIGYLVDTGVPHLVLFDEIFFKNAKNYRLDMNVNVSLVSKTGDDISIRTYERGVEGETLACGTGGAAAALILKELNPNKNNFNIIFASGEVALYSFDSKGRLWMEGIIKYLFEGNYENEDWCSERN
jgi:diaminopimelate epimerase